MTRRSFPRIVVNGTAIPSAAIAAAVRLRGAPAGSPGQAWRAAARALVVRELLRQEAVRRGIEPDRCRLPDRSAEGEEAAIRDLLEEEIDVESPTEAELRAAYEAAPDQFPVANAAEPAPYEIVRHRIAASIERRRWTEAARAFTARLIAAATLEGVSFDDRTLARLRGRA